MLHYKLSEKRNVPAKFLRSASDGPLQQPITLIQSSGRRSGTGGFSNASLINGRLLVLAEIAYLLPFLCLRSPDMIEKRMTNLQIQ